MIASGPLEDWSPDHSKRWGLLDWIGDGAAWTPKQNNDTMTSISRCPGFPGFLDPWTPGNPGTLPCLTAVRRHVGVSGETRHRFQLDASRRRHLTQNLLYLQLDKFTTPLGSNRSQRSAKAQCRASFSHATHAGPRLNQGFRRPRDRAGTGPT